MIIHIIKLRKEDFFCEAPPQPFQIATEKM